MDVKIHGEDTVITESNRMVCSSLQGNVNDDEGGADMGIVENVDQIEMQEEEQDIIPPYFQHFFREEDSWYKLVRFEDYYRLAHVEEQIAK